MADPVLLEAIARGVAAALREGGVVAGKGQGAGSPWRAPSSPSGGVGSGSQGIWSCPCGGRGADRNWDSRSNCRVCHRPRPVAQVGAGASGAGGKGAGKSVGAGRGKGASAAQVQPGVSRVEDPVVGKNLEQAPKTYASALVQAKSRGDEEVVRAFGF